MLDKTTTELSNKIQKKKKKQNKNDFFLLLKHENFRYFIEFFMHIFFLHLYDRNTKNIYSMKWIEENNETTQMTKGVSQIRPRKFPHFYSTVKHIYFILHLLFHTAQILCVFDLLKCVPFSITHKSSESSIFCIFPNAVPFFLHFSFMSKLGPFTL